MNTDFLITKISNVIFVGTGEYNEPKTDFSGDLKHNELIFHFSGKAIVHFNGKTFETDENTIRFLPNGKNREYIVERENQGECIDIFFDTDIPISEEAFILKAKNSEKTGSLFKKLFSIWVAKNNGYYFECISLLYKIFSEMQRDNYIPENQYDLIKPSLKYIEENFLNGKISIEYLAEICNISESYLKKLFMKKFGMSPIKYIIRIKINYACDLLRSELYNITQISEICGYSNVYYFSRQFKETVGISPLTFIKKYKSSK